MAAPEAAEEQENNLLILYWTEATLLELPDEYFEDVVNYVLKQAYEMDEDWEASQVKSQQLSESLLKRGEEERTAQNMTYETITVVDDYYGGY